MDLPDLNNEFLCFRLSLLLLVINMTFGTGLFRWISLSGCCVFSGISLGSGAFFATDFSVFPVFYPQKSRFHLQNHQKPAYVPFIRENNRLFSKRFFCLAPSCCGKYLPALSTNKPLRNTSRKTDYPFINDSFFLRRITTEFFYALSITSQGAKKNGIHC